MALLLALSATPLFAADAQDSQISTQIDVKPAAAVGPQVQVPAPRPDKAVVDEVIGTLDLGRSTGDEAPPTTRVSAASKRLARPFPEPPFLTLSPSAVAQDYDGWEFEVLSGRSVVWRTEGEGRLTERVEWDGSGTAGDTAARVGEQYYFRFLGKAPGAPVLLLSEPIRLKSIALREFLGSVDLEVSNDVLFERGKAEFSLEAPAYLAEMAERMRRSDTPAAESYKLVLYDDAPRGKLAQARARLLRRYFSKELIVAPEKIRIDALTTGGRGRATVCVLPPEKGDRFKTR